MNRSIQILVILCIFCLLVDSPALGSDTAQKKPWKGKLADGTEITVSDLHIILEKHKKWLNSKGEEGEVADLNEADLSNAQQVLFPLLGLAVIYQCWIGARCLPYLNTVVLLFDDGIEVLHKNESTEYQWMELDVVEYSFATTTKIAKKDGSTIAYLSDGIPNLALMVGMISGNND